MVAWATTVGVGGREYRCFFLPGAAVTAYLVRENGRTAYGSGSVVYDSGFFWRRPDITEDDLRRCLRAMERAVVAHAHGVSPGDLPP